MIPLKLILDKLDVKHGDRLIAIDPNFVRQMITEFKGSTATAFAALLVLSFLSNPDRNIIMATTTVAIAIPFLVVGFLATNALTGATVAPRRTYRILVAIRRAARSIGGGVVAMLLARHSNLWATLAYALTFALAVELNNYFMDAISRVPRGIQEQKQLPPISLTETQEVATLPENELD